MKTLIRDRRQALGLSQRELARKVGVTDAYIALLETGKKTNPSLDVLKALAKALDVDVADLLG